MMSRGLSLGVHLVISAPVDIRAEADMRLAPELHTANSEESDRQTARCRSYSEGARGAASTWRVTR